MLDAFIETENVVKSLDTSIRSLRDEYEDVSRMADNARKLAVDAATFGRPWNIEPMAMNAVIEYSMIDVAVRMVDKYLVHVGDFISTPPSKKTQHIASLKEQGAPSTDLQWFWDRVLRWQKEVNKFSKEHPETVKQVDGDIERYKKRIYEWNQKHKLDTSDQ